MTTQLFPIKNNISRVTFNYVRDNPGSTRKEILTTLDHQGFAQGSTSSLLSQMVKNKMIHITAGAYYADIPEYVPIKAKKPTKSRGLAPAREPVKIKRKYTKRDTTGIGALLQAKIEAAPDRVASHPDTALPKRLVTLVRTQTPDDIIKNLTVFQARDLYDRLKQIFGG